MPRTCVNSPDNFCYVCGEVTFSSQKRTITAMVKKGYHLYFGCKIGDQDKSLAPYVCCNRCATNLRQWLNRKRKSMPFAVPMIWREPTDQTSNCYFCLVPAIDKGLSKKKRLQYNIQTFHRLYVQYHMAKVCQSLNHQYPCHWSQMRNSMKMNLQKLKLN